MKHVDDWLDEPHKDEDERLAKEWLEHFRRPAVEKDYHWLAARIVTCVYEGKPYYCIGASRIGDVWLASTRSPHGSYELRVDIDKCSHWKVVLR